MTGQLPPAGGTTSVRPAEAPPTDALSLDEAIDMYGVSMSTLRRRLREEAVAGAYKINGPKGAEWRIPKGALEQLGYTANGGDHVHGAAMDVQPPPPPQPPAPSPDVEQLAGVVKDLSQMLAQGQRQLMAAEEDRGQINRDLIDARVQAETLRAENERLAGELEAARARRRWFRR